MHILNTPIRVNHLELKNRLVMPPMATAKSDPDGHVTPDICAYYDEKSAGGYIGLIITEHSFISQEGKASQGQMSLSRDSDVSGLAQLVEVIRKNGCPVMAQINHAGSAAKTEITGREVLSASPVQSPKGNSIPQEMTPADIRKVIEDFTAAAIRVKKAGFDGVEIHSAHGYLLNQFYSPLANKRTDEYGAHTIHSRLKLHLEVIKAVREAVGADYPVALRLGACDYMDGGSTLEDSVAAAKILEEAGIDLLDISGGICGYVRPDTQEQGYFSELTEAVKKVVHIPVILTGGITDGNAAESLLELGKADMIGVGRAMFKDSAWAENAMRSLQGR